MVAPGFRGNLTNLSAAIGLAPLERAEEFRQGRQPSARFYRQHLADLPGRTG